LFPTDLIPFNLSEGSPWKGKDFGCFIAPKGLKNLAQGFNPGNHEVRRLALKGREIAWAKPTLMLHRKVVLKPLTEAANVRDDHVALMRPLSNAGLDVHYKESRIRSVR
jgi:hypothetical protein